MKDRTIEKTGIVKARLAIERARFVALTLRRLGRLGGFDSRLAMT